LANIVNELLKAKLPKQKLEELIEKYHKPQNCENLVSPNVSKEVWLQPMTITKNGDHSLQKAQKLFIWPTYALLEACQKASGELRTSLVHTLVLSLSGNRELNLSRRKFLKPDLNAQYAALCNPTTPITSELFGDDVAKEIYDLSKANRLGKKLSTL